MTTPQQEVDSLLAELDSEFGKRKKHEPSARDLNRAWHQANTPLTKGAKSFARTQLERAEFRNYYDWETHRVRVLEEHGAQVLDDLEWWPEAQVTYVVRQRCGTCNSCTEFVGNEFIRFRGRRRRFLVLGGETRDMSPTVLRRVADCDPDLIAFGLADGTPLQDLIEEIDETVRRCAGCVMVEQRALQLWEITQDIAEGKSHPQADLPGFDEAMEETQS